ncbi:hypothetical protein EW145_g7602, partial [Phellinidium pouzarii]
SIRQSRGQPAQSTSRVSSPSPSCSRSRSPDAERGNEDDELARIRALLRPAPIAGVQDWGIPPPSLEPDSPHRANAPRSALDEARALPRAEARRHGTAPFQRRAHGEPRVSQPAPVWDPRDVKEEWFAERIAEQQKRREERQAAMQASGKRARIDFTSSSSAVSSSSAAKTSSYTRGGGVLANKYSGASAGDANRRSRFAPYPPGGRWG